MTNLYMNWTQLKTKHIAEGLEFKYANQGTRWQIYLIDSADAYITYLPSQAALNDPNFIGNRTSLQADLTDWDTNHKSNANETTGVAD
jgi:hypothetical protein